MKNTKKYTVHTMNINDLIILPSNKKKLNMKYVDALMKSLNLYKK
jgi:hypothetical protein